jgi:ATP-dependent DNA helicase 2 subunit 2
MTVSPKAKGSRRGKDTIKPLSGLDVLSLLNRENRQKISAENAIPEFKQMLSNTTDDNAVIDAANQMAEIVRRLVTESTANLKYARAIENLKVLREQMLEFEMPEIYNAFMRDFKKRLVAEQLGGNRKEFWFDVMKARLGLIDKNALEISDVSGEDAQEVRHHLLYSKHILTQCCSSTNSVLGYQVVGGHDD